LERIRQISINSKEIFIIDYSDCKEGEMIDLVSELKRQVIAENMAVRILSVFNDRCYVTPKFMRHAEGATREAIHLIEKQAMIGLNGTKKMILKGYNFLFNTNIKTFNTIEEAMEFLLDDHTTDKDDSFRLVRK